MKGPMLNPAMCLSYPQGVFAVALGCEEALSGMGALQSLLPGQGLQVPVSPGCEAQVHPYLGEFGGEKYACGILGIRYRPDFSRNSPDRERLPTEEQAWSCAARALKHFASGVRKRVLLRLEEGLPARLLLAVVIPLEGPIGQEAACRILGEAFPPGRINHDEKSRSI